MPWARCACGNKSENDAKFRLLLSNFRPYCVISRDGRPAPPRTVGKGGFPALPRPVKMIKTAGKLRGKI